MDQGGIFYSVFPVTASYFHVWMCVCVRTSVPVGSFVKHEHGIIDLWGHNKGYLSCGVLILTHHYPACGAIVPPLLWRKTGANRWRGWRWREGRVTGDKGEGWKGQKGRTGWRIRGLGGAKKRWGVHKTNTEWHLLRAEEKLRGFISILSLKWVLTHFLSALFSLHLFSLHVESLPFPWRPPKEFQLGELVTPSNAFYWKG